MNYREFGCHYMRVLQLRRWHHILNLKNKESLYYGQLPILEYIRNNPGCKQKDVADNFLLSRAAVTKSIKRMLKNEVVKREINSLDERQFQLFITEKGMQLTEEARSSMNSVDELAFKNFSEEEKDQINSYILRIVDNLETDYSRSKQPRELMVEIENMQSEEED